MLSKRDKRKIKRLTFKMGKKILFLLAIIFIGGIMFNNLVIPIMLLLMGAFKIRLPK